MTNFTSGLAELSPQQRLELIEWLWDSLDEKDVPVTDAERAELEGWIAGFDEDRKHSVAWDELQSELRRRR